MDHFRQIPQVGRAWDDFLESYTTLAYLAACTERVRVGALVTEFTAWYDAREQKILTALLGALQKKVEQQKTDIKDANRQIDEIVRTTGREDFEMLIQNTEAEFIYRQKQLEALETSLTQLEHNGNPGEFLDKLTLDQIGIVHPPMAERMPSPPPPPSLL